MPSIGLGTWQLDDDECHDAVLAALDLGYQHIDTAQIYQNETSVGRALKNAGVARDELWITSKLWRDDMHPEHVRPSVERSLERLGLDTLELMLIHWPNDEVPLTDTLSALHVCREEGLIRNVGVSNFPSALLREAADAGPIANIQIEFHPYLQPRTLLHVADELSIPVTAYSPLAAGAVLDDATLQAIAISHGVELPVVVLHWLLGRGAASVLTRSTKVDRLAAALAAPSLELTEPEIAEIEGLHRNLRTCPAWFPLSWDVDRLDSMGE